MLPDDLKASIAASGLLIGPGDPIPAGDAELAAIRRAIRTERRTRVVYADEHGRTTDRTIWPVALAFYDRVRVVAWCELRAGYRHFRTDRIAAIEVTDERYPRRRNALFKEWRMLRGIPEQ